MTYADLVTFLEGGDCKGAPGSIYARNSCRMPFVHDLDFRAAVNVPVGRFKPEFTVDVLNLMNLFDRTQGQVLYAAFNDLLVANGSEAAGKYTYAINSVARPNAVRFSRDDLRSRWQAQVGLRLRF